MFDIEHELEEFFENTASLHRSEYSLDMVVGEILLYISDKNYAKIGLEAMERDLIEMHCPSNGYGPEDGLALATASTTLGNKMLQRFLDLNAYLSDGTLPYELDQWIRKDSYTPTPVLRKCLDYVS